jgi:hypothetical protein
MLNHWWVTKRVMGMASRREFLAAATIAAGLSLRMADTSFSDEAKKRILKESQARDMIRNLNQEVYKDAIAYKVDVREGPDKLFEELWPSAKAIFERAFLLID